MLKTKIVVLFGALTLMLSSCGGTDICDCLNLSFDMMEESMGLEMDDIDGRKAIDEKYKADQEACEPIVEDYEKKMEGKTDEEKMQAQEDLFEKCGLSDKLN